jgi:hypothetical protein
MARDPPRWFPPAHSFPTPRRECGKPRIEAGNKQKISRRHRCASPGLKPQIFDAAVIGTDKSVPFQRNYCLISSFARSYISESRCGAPAPASVRRRGREIGCVVCSEKSGNLMKARELLQSLHPPAMKSWSRSRVRGICPRRHLRVLPTRTRPSLFGGD